MITSILIVVGAIVSACGLFYMPIKTDFTSRNVTKYFLFAALTCVFLILIATRFIPESS